MKWKKEVLSCVILVVIILAFFYKTVFFGLLPVPSDTLVGLYHPWRDVYAKTNPRGVPFKNFLITDPMRQQIPWRKIVIDTWKSGSIPKFNPYTFLGVPLDANIQAAPFYPLNILFFIFPFSVAWTILIILQPVLAGLFLYLYLRHNKLSQAASVIGALSWAFSGFNIAWLTWGTISHTALWLPLILLSIDKKWIIIGTVGMIMAMTAGHAQIALYAIIVSFLYAIWRKTFKSFFVIAFFSSIISIPQWMPFIKNISESARISDNLSWHNPGWFMPWQNLVQFIAPDFFGNPATMNYFGEWNYGEFIGYIGIIPLLLAVSALFLSRISRFFSILFAYVLLFILPTPIAKLPFLLNIPVFSVLQPTRLLFIIDICLAILAAIGFDYLQKNPKRFMRSLWTIGILLSVMWIMAFLFNLPVSVHNLILPTILFASSVAWYFWRKSLGIIIILIIIFDVFRFGWKFTPFTPQEYFFPSSKIIEYLQKQPKPFRVMSLDDRITPPNVLTYYGIESIEGYDPIASKIYNDLLRSVDPGKIFNRIYTTSNFESPYLNVKYVLSLEDIKSPKLQLVMREGETRVYEFMEFLPRIYITNGIADIESYKNNKIIVKVSTDIPDALNFLNVFDPRWKVTVDGKFEKIYKVNNYFIGVDVPAGNHKIEFIYE